MKKRIAKKDAPQMSDFDAVMIVEGALEADEDTYIRAAQRLIDSGLAWSLQGFFGRACADLIDRGLCRG